MIRLGVTDLDSWLAYTEPKIEAFELSMEQLITRLRREEAPSPEMAAGTAFHSVMERLFEGELDYAEEDGFEFFFECEATIAMPEYSEMNIERVYPSSVGDVLLRGRIDRRDGDIITDYKLTFGPFDGERYADSMQWRAYLDMTGARQFSHLVFQGNMKGNRIWIYDAHDLRQFAYPEMHSDVARTLDGLARFAALHTPERIVMEAA